MTAISELVYLVAAILFIVGLKRLSHPSTARRGNLLSAVGMLLAIGITLLDRQILSFQWIIIGVLVGAGLGAWMARAVAMTSMPQMVGLFNGFGGGASVLVAAGEWHRLVQPGATLDGATAVTVYASALIGSVTFSGSVVAAGKLQEWIPGRPVLFRGQHALNLLLALGVVGVAVYLSAVAQVPAVFIALIAIALMLGVLLTIPIGGADMPVVICLLRAIAIRAMNTAGACATAERYTATPNTPRASSRFSACWPRNSTGRPGIHSWSFPAGTTLPQNVKMPIRGLAETGTPA